MEHMTQKHRGLALRSAVALAAVAFAFFLFGQLTQVEARRSNISGLYSSTVLSRQALTVSTPVTTTAIPVGMAEDVALWVSVTGGLGPSVAVTLTTLADGSPAATLMGYAVPVGLAGQRVVSSSTTVTAYERVYPVFFPGGVDTLQWTVEAGPAAGATVKVVASAQ